MCGGHADEPVASYREGDVVRVRSPEHAIFEEHIGPEQLKSFVLYDPSVIGRSLDKRFRPRLAQARDHGLEIDAGCMGRMALNTDARWTKSLAFQQKKQQPPVA